MDLFEFLEFMLEFPNHNSLIASGSELVVHIALQVSHSLDKSTIFVFKLLVGGVVALRSFMFVAWPAGVWKVLMSNQYRVEGSCTEQTYLAH